MPTISSNDKVLVTGANGYVALWIVKTLLERGNFVRAAVRSESKTGHLKELFKEYGNRLEFAIVPDMTKEGAWDDAVKGITQAQHTASPVEMSVPNPAPETFIEPAIKGTVRLLESASKNREIKRVVITSSFAAIGMDFNTPRVYSEEDWNDVAVQAVEAKGSEAGLFAVYSASKTHAERAAWDFYKAHKSEISWDLTVINPPLVLGPPLGIATSPDTLNGSLQMFYNFVVADGPKTREQLALGNAWVDVRDLAEIHVRAAETEKARGQRILVLAGTMIFQELVDAAISLNLPNRKLGAGFPDLDKARKSTVSKEKALQIFDPELKYRSQAETIKDTLDHFAKHGF